MRAVVSVLVGVAIMLVAQTNTVQGQTFDCVNFSSQANWTWAGTDAVGAESGIFLPGAPTGMVTLGKDLIPFDIKTNVLGKEAWSAYAASDGGSGQVSITIDVNDYGATSVYTLINTFWGQEGPNYYASLVFTGSGGASYTYPLVGDFDIRDYNESDWTDTIINGPSTEEVFSVAEDIEGVPGRLDMQKIALPPDFRFQTLTTIELVDNGDSDIQRCVLDGVTVAAVPEPSTFLLLAVAAVGLFAWHR